LALSDLYRPVDDFRGIYGFGPETKSHFGRGLDDLILNRQRKIFK